MIHFLRKIDENGMFVEDVLWDDEETDDTPAIPIPENMIATPVPGGFYWPKWDGAKWVEGGAPPIKTPDRIVSDLTAALERHYDATANERRYDTRYTCALRAGYAGPFQAEGIAFAQWMDGCNALAYQIMGEVVAGIRPIPTESELVSLMPPMVWPA